MADLLFHLSKTSNPLARAAAVANGINYDDAVEAGITDEEILRYVESMNQIKMQANQMQAQRVASAPRQNTLSSGGSFPLGLIDQLMEKAGLGTGWGNTAAGVGAIEAVRQPTNNYISDKYSDDWSTAHNMVARAGQGAQIGGQIVPGWGHLVGALAGADIGNYEGNTGNSFYSGQGQKDFLLSNMSGMPYSLIGYDQKGKIPSWLQWASNPVYPVLKKVFSWF